MAESRNTRADSASESQEHADGGTRRDETPELEGRVPLPEELTGRASGTDDDLVALFNNPSGDHLADGFRGGSDDEFVDDDDVPPDDVTADVEQPLDTSEL